MLNKDQYNQDEYNNYYKQESEGAEIQGFDDEGSKGKIIIFLGLIALAIAGYFGLKMFNSTTDSNQMGTKEKLVVKEEHPKEPVVTAQSIEEVKKSEPQPSDVVVEKQVKKIENTIKEEVSKQVQASIQNNQGMSSDEIAKVVDLVMSKMNQTKDTKANTDNALLSALEKTDTDTVKVKVEEKKVIDIKAAVQEKKKTVSSYNKVTIKSTNEEDLTELSEQIKKLLNMDEESSEPRKKSTGTTIKEESQSSKNYTESINKEIKTRSNEMRVIVVKPGDTLNKIAKRAYGNGKSYHKIITANPDILNQNDKIYVGQKLRIPK